MDVTRRAAAKHVPSEASMDNSCACSPFGHNGADGAIVDVFAPGQGRSQGWTARRFQRFQCSRNSKSLLRSLRSRIEPCVVLKEYAGGSSILGRALGRTSATA